MIDFLTHWQTLIGAVVSGSLAVLAGALIFIEGTHHRLALLAEEQAEVEEWLQLLLERCVELARLIKDDRRSLRDCVEELERTEVKAAIRQLVPPDVFPRASGMKIILQQLMARRTPYRVLLALSELVEVLDMYESDFNTLRDAMLVEIRERRRSQQVLSFARTEAAWQKAYGTLELSTVRVRGKLKEINDLLRERTSQAQRDTVQEHEINNETTQEISFVRLRHK